MSEENEIDEGELAEDVTEKIGDGKKKTVRVEHVFEDRRGLPQSMIDDAEKTKKLKEKLQEREQQLALLALKEFADEKERVLELVPEARRVATERYIGDKPDRLEQIKFQYGYTDDEDDGAEAVPPKGKVKRLLRTPKSENEVQTNIISELYKIRKEPATTPLEVRKQRIAEEKTDQLFAQVEEGLKARPKGDKYNFQVAQCSKCNTVLFGKDAENWARKGICSACGYQPKRGNR